MLGDII